MEEFEIKFLEVDVPELQRKLLSIGAKKVGEYGYTRVMFDYPDWRMDKDHAWLKLRTDGKETTLSFKQRLGAKVRDGSIPDEGMKEIEVVVRDFQKTFNLLLAIGLIIKREQKNKRIRYKKGEIVYDIDSWPRIPPFVEIESSSFESSQKAATELGFDPEKGLVCSPSNVYVKYGIDPNDYSVMTFEKFVKK